MKRLLLVLPLLGAACGHAPSRVTDLENGNVYYTRDLRRGLTSGNVYLKEVKTGEQVVVHSSKIENLSEEDFRLAAGLK
ncbi:MAG TPA: hypothetical protein VFY93_08150 [Planctomycetota bacterium]|nr:hypothetical protein [Planctomycetota bacterium]